MSEHKTKAIPGFTSRYYADRLVYFEETDVLAAISREKEIKGWTRAEKVAPIESANSRWDELSEGWFDAPHDRFSESTVASQIDERRAQ